MKVLVVGGGIIGCATAYELAKAGCQVAVFERATAGAEASSAAAGLLAPLGESNDTNFARLALASWRLYPGVVDELQRRTGIDVEYVTRGTIYPMSATQTRRDADAWALNKEFGVEVVEGADVQALEPALSPKIRHAIFVKGDHWLNNQRLVLAYAQAAAAAGVELETGRNVSRLVVEGGRARAVVTEGERFDGDAVLLAAGAWSGELMAGLGATVERAGFQRAVTAEGIAGLLRAAIELVPSLRELPIARTWCGFRPWAPDSLPVLGPWPGVDGLFVATGHFRNGILLAPITARLMTEWITGGQPSLTMTDFLPERFGLRHQRG